MQRIAAVGCIENIAPPNRSSEGFGNPCFYQSAIF